MKIKQFNLPNFEEWCRCNREIRKNLGAYRVEIRRVAWNNEYTAYEFAVALSNTNACNVFTDRLFNDRFNDYGDDEKLKQWYEKAVRGFHDFWEEHIKTTYLEF